MSEVLTHIGSALAAAKATLDLLRSAKDISDGTKMNEILVAANERLLELQHSMLDTQQKASELQQERDSAQRELVDERNKNNLCQNYELVEPRPGVFLYAYKIVEGATTPRHYACPNCFSQRSISILQQVSPADQMRKCPRCPFSCDIRHNAPAPKINTSGFDPGIQSLY